jgi:putative FmdB family regulatory protein
MPIYEYECPKCEKVIEIMQKFSDPPVRNCPDCAGPVTKLVSRTSFQLKGTGWYVTDYKKGSSPKPKGPESTTTSTSDSSGTESTSQKAAKKTGSSE